MNFRAFALSLSVTAFATPALADLKADDVLSALTTQLGFLDILDVSVQGKVRNGSTLSVASVSATLDIENVPLTVSLGPLIYEELGDGSVAIRYPGPITARSTSADGNGAPIVVTAEMEFSDDVSHVATGDPERIRYEFAASNSRISNLVIESDETFDATLDLNMSGISSVTEIAPGDTHFQTVDYTLDKMTALIEFTDPDSEGEFRLKYALADMVVDYELEFTLATLMTSVAQALRDGNHLSMAMTTGEFIQDMHLNSPYDSMVTTSRNGGSTMSLSLDEAGVNYQAGYEGHRAEMSGSNFPLSVITYALDSADMRLVFPLLPSDDAQPIAMRLSMLGLSMGNEIWNLFDPSEELGRDPVDFVIDVEGETTLTDDFLSLEKLEGMDNPPFAASSVRLNELRLSAMGAELTGNGEVTDTSTDGVPSGVGLLNFALNGGHGLLDTLVGMGLLQEDQASGARMMMGLFARPGDGEDTLVSTIELQEDGSVLANGQRIK